MKLENQVVSLELAKKLKELGFEQESLFYWRAIVGNPNEKTKYILCYKNIKGRRKIGKDLIKIASAYTVAELGEIGKTNWLKWQHLNNADKPITYLCFSMNQEEEGETMADATAKMLIYLKENKLINH